MKTMRFLLLSFVILTVSGCQSQETIEQSESGKLAGAWEFVSARVFLPDTTLIYDESGHSLYIMSESHFAFVSSTADDKELTFAGRGSYSIDGNTYTEHVEFHTNTGLIGQSVTFEFQLENDTMTKTSSIPVWEEIRPLAGDASEVRLEEVRRRISGFMFNRK